MKFRVLSLPHAARLQNLVSSFRKQGPFAILGLGGALTVLWIVLITWIPLRLITSAISRAVADLL
jgi:hypothetical protein